MKKYKVASVLILLIANFAWLYSQTEKPEYIFKMDQIANEFEAGLVKKQVDTLIKAYYFFDNGRGAKATRLFFWKENGISFVKAIRNKNTKKAKDFDTRECPEFIEILDYYSKNSEEMFSSLPKPTMLVSHNYGYNIEIKIDKDEFQTYIRDERRIGVNHPISEWVNMIAEVAEPYIEEK